MAEIIELKNIYKTFTTGKKSFNAVEDASVSIQKGEIFGIIGFSGAGKSTLVRVINLLGRPTSGSVIVRGKDFLSLSPKELREERKTIGMIFQHFNLMKRRTVFSNVAFPLKRSGLLKEEIADKVHKLLALVEIEDKEKVYPSQLSGGQKQRVAIARALANNPDILLCDEVTKRFIRSTSNLTKIEQLIAEDSPVVKLAADEKLVRFTFIEKNVSEPIISAMSRLYEITINIIFADESGMQMISFGHAGDGNVHLCVVRGGRSEQAWESELHANLEKLYAKAKDFGGLISGEHGLGVSKRDFFFSETPSQNVVLMNAIKKSFDTKRILNPKISYVK